MATLQAILTSLGRSTIRLLNVAFGWATVPLFGRLPDARQDALSLIALAAFIWMNALVGIVSPDLGVFLLSYMRLPPWVDRTLVRLVMLVAVLLTPLLTGFLSRWILDPEERARKAGGAWAAFVRGVRYALAFSLILILLTFLAPVLGIRTVVRRWTTEHLPVRVIPGDYALVVDEVQATLLAGGWPTQARPASWMLRFPVALFVWLTRDTLPYLIADRLTTLHSEQLEVVIYPSDLAVAARDADGAHARGLITERLAFSGVYFTWTERANALEDRLRALWREVVGVARPAGDAPAVCLRAIESDLCRLKVSYEEWDALFRQTLLIARALLWRREECRLEVEEANKPVRSPSDQPQPPVQRRAPGPAASTEGLRHA